MSYGLLNRTLCNDLEGHSAVATLRNEFIEHLCNILHVFQVTQHIAQSLSDS